MPREEMDSEEERRAIKKDLNTEGFEGDDEGGAAVFVGTKEEVTKARQLAESGGRAPDMASYIVMHKEILAGSEELQNYVNDECAVNFKRMPIGAMYLEKDKTANMLLLYFKDSSSNLAKVEIDVSKITSLGPALSKYGTGNEVAKFNIVMEDLVELGFSQYAPLSQWNPKNIEDIIKKSRLAKIKDEQRKGFAF